jgi:hypothetical protein
VNILETEFIKWVIVRDAMTAVSFLAAFLFAARIGRSSFKKESAKEPHQDREYTVPVICGLFCLFASFVIQQNVHGLVKATIAPEIFIRTHRDLAGVLDAEEIRKQLKP